MGIYDRDYIRRDPPPGAYARSPVGSAAMWSVNTWLIVICVAVYVIDGFVPRRHWQPVIVSEDLPAEFALGTVDAARYDLWPPGDPGRDLFVKQVYEKDSGDLQGSVTYMRMPPLKRWLHFSTALTFLRPLQVFEFWRFVGFQFLHANFVHLLFNMIALYFFGPLVERALGRKRYLAFYLLCGIFGALMYLLLNVGGFVLHKVFQTHVQVPGLLFDSPYTPLIGASAGVFGVLMAGAFLAPRVTVLLFFFLPMQLKTLAYALVVIAVFTVLTGGPNAGGEAGHLGGALAGFYFIRHPKHLHGFFDFLGRIDPTSHHYRRVRAATPRAADQREVDRILDKIHHSGLHSLTEQERRILREASER